MNQLCVKLISGKTITDDERNDTMASRTQIEIAQEIAQDVIENGRVIGDGDEWKESLRNEVEFECGERGYEDCEEIADAAVKLYR